MRRMFFISGYLSGWSAMASVVIPPARHVLVTLSARQSGARPAPFRPLQHCNY